MLFPRPPAVRISWLRKIINFLLRPLRRYILGRKKLFGVTIKNPSFGFTIDEIVSSNQIVKKEEILNAREKEEI